MPFYRYEHDCGYNHTQSLSTDKDSVVLNCLRCGRGVSARQVRDKTIMVKENNEVKGVFRHDGGHNANQ
jgi:hypothetical protein